MKLIKSLAAVALTVVASAAIAQPVPPTAPVSGGPPNGDNDNSGLILSVWDSVAKVSLVEYLGVSVNDFAGTSPLATVTPDGGLNLNFGQMGGSGPNTFSSLFGSNNTNVQWMVTGYDRNPEVDGVYDGLRVLTTTNGVLAGTNNTPFNISEAANSFYAILNQQATGQPCAEGNPCVATIDTAADYAGKPLWGNKYSGALGVVATAGLGTQLGFYELSGSDTADGSTAAIVSRFKNATSNAYWLLSATGNLIYHIDGAVSAVPLPAAVWLLLSGLAGVGVVGRRRAA